MKGRPRKQINEALLLELASQIKSDRKIADIYNQKESVKISHMMVRRLLLQKRIVTKKKICNKNNVTKVPTSKNKQKAVKRVTKQFFLVPITTDTTTLPLTAIPEALITVSVSKSLIYPIEVKPSLPIQTKEDSIEPSEARRGDRPDLKRLGGHHTGFVLPFDNKIKKELTKEEEQNWVGNRKNPYLSYKFHSEKANMDVRGDKMMIWVIKGTLKNSDYPNKMIEEAKQIALEFATKIALKHKLQLHRSKIAFIPEGHIVTETADFNEFMREAIPKVEQKKLAENGVMVVDRTDKGKMEFNKKSSSRGENFLWMLDDAKDEVKVLRESFGQLVNEMRLQRESDAELKKSNSEAITKLTENFIKLTEDIAFIRERLK